MYEDQGPLYQDPNRPVDAQGEIWIMISENSRLLCELVEDGKKSIWSDAEDGGATEAQSSGTQPRVTSSTTEAASSSHKIFPQIQPPQTEAK